jgi:hypothetical protein
MNEQFEETLYKLYNMNDTYVQDNGDLFSVCNAKRLEDGNK